MTSSRLSARAFVPVCARAGNSLRTLRIVNGECPPLEATNKQQLVKIVTIVTDWEDLVCRTVTA
jgi:hypothetical protein